jgi:serine/threonine protein kinase/predicted ATPase
MTRPNHGFPERFSIARRLGAGGMGVVYEAFDTERRQTVALKTLREFGPAALYRFKHEFRALAEIVHPNLIPLYELVAEDDRWFFTMELVDGGTDLLSFVRPDLLKPDTSTESPTSRELEGATREEASLATRAVAPAAVGDSPPDLPQRPASNHPVAAGHLDFERIRGAFRQLAEGVSALHAAGKLHRDLKPSNVLVTPGGRIVVLDFGLVADLDEESPPDTTGTWPATPGTSARTYHSTDRGLTGTVAYMSPEQAARVPLTPASDWYTVGVMLFQVLTGRLPFTGSAIEVLIGKQQTPAPPPSSLVSGLPSDLEALCVALLDRDATHRPIQAEVMARLGASDRVPVAGSQPVGEGAHFVGRSSHLAELERAFATMLDGHPVVCHVAGRSGAGKSTLISRFVNGLSGAHGAVVLAGRCYEQESVPYKAVDSLVDVLTRHLMDLPDEEVAAITPRYMAELGRVFPVLNRVESLLQQPRDTSDAWDLLEVRRRAFEALRALFDGLSRLRPLVLQIDDLQWGDVDSAALLSDLLQPPNAPRLLLLLAYRSEYVGTSACLQVLAARRPSAGNGQVERHIDVDALTPDETRSLALALLGPGRPHAQAEAEWIVSESRGGAFFVYELVEHLKSGAGIATTQPDLDDVLWQRIGRLPEDARRLLEVVAVAGKPIRLRIAQEAASLPLLGPQVVASLRAHRLVRTTGPGLQDDIETFHDRIRESIAANLGTEAVRHHHASLAAFLEASSAADAETLAQHLDAAGDRERASTYYERAAAQAVTVLAFDRAETLFKRAVDLAAGASDRARIHERMIHFYTDMARFEDAYAIGRTAVEAYGVRLPARFIPPLFLVDFLRARARLRGRTPTELLNLPTASDERLEMAVHLMNAVAKAAYQIKPQLCIAVATKLVRLCLQHGNTRDSAIGYMVFGCIFQGGVLGNHRAGHEFGRLALDLVEKYRNEQQKAEVHFVVGYFGTSWLEPSTRAEALWQVAYDSGLETGDLFHTGCACAGTTMSYHMRGVPMDRVWQETDRFLEVLRRNRLREPIGTLTAVRQAIRNLRGQTQQRTSLSDDGFDEEAFAKEASTFGSRHFAHFYLIVKLQLQYLWGDHDAALATAEQSARYLKDSPGMLHSAEHHFYEALVLSALGRSGWKVRRTHRRFRKWAADCPENFLSKAQILAGEIARRKGRVDDAVARFVDAEQTAAKYGYVHMQALAAHRASVTLKGAGRETEGDVARARAVDAYKQWGATAYAEFVASGG